MTINGAHNVLAAIKAAGWEQLMDSNREVFLVEDLDAPDTDADEYLIDADTVTRMRNGFRQEVMWTRAVACECGAWSGEACQWSGPVAATALVEFMPEHLRASHAAAGNRGVYPANGAMRIRVEQSCATRMLAEDGDWTEVVA